MGRRAGCGASELMQNGKKARALVVLAVISQLAICGILVGCWVWGPPISTEMLIGVVAFFQQVVLTVVGFLAGSSAPDHTTTATTVTTPSTTATKVEA